MLFTGRSAEAACPRPVLPSAAAVAEVCVCVSVCVRVWKFVFHCVCVDRLGDKVITTGPFIWHPLSSQVHVATKSSEQRH